MSDTECAYYRTRVIEMSRSRDHSSPGRHHYYAGTVAEELRDTPFFVEDAAGRVRVKPEGAEVDALKAVDEKVARQPEKSVTVGGVKVDLCGRHGTLGFRYLEEALPVDAPVYVLGVVDEHAEIAGSGDRDRHLMISRRKEKEFSRRQSRKVLLFTGGAGGLLAVGGLFLLIPLPLIAALIFGG